MTSHIEKMSLARLVEYQAQRQPALTVLQFVRNEEGTDTPRWSGRTFVELNVRSQKLAAAMRALGCRQHVAVMMHNRPEFVEAMLAGSRLGVPIVLIDPRSMGEKLAFMLDHADCCGVICAEESLEQICRVQAHCPQLDWIICVDTPAAAERTGIYDYDALLAVQQPVQTMAEDDLERPMLLMFTSGTTGNPKAVVYSQERYMAPALALSAMGVGASDCLYTGLSLTHLNAQVTLRSALALGVPAVISFRFTKRRMWDICRHYGCTVMSLLSGMIPEVYAMPAAVNDGDNPVRLIFTSGMPSSLWREFEARYNVRIFEAYGATEGGTLANPPGVGPIGSIGRPVPGWQAEILDGEGRPCAPYTEGEICFRRTDGGPLSIDYYKNTSASLNKIRDGWLHMGDLGHKDDEGWFYFHHRIGGGVRRNGHFVNTALVESVVLKSGLVDDVFAYGISADSLSTDTLSADTLSTDILVAGEKRLVLALVPIAGIPFDENALREFCRLHLEKNDMPECFQVLDAIPKTTTAKPLERECIRLFNASAKDFQLNQSSN